MVDHTSASERMPTVAGQRVKDDGRIAKDNTGWFALDHISRLMFIMRL